MMWWRNGYEMLTVRAAEQQFELLRVRADGTELVARFARREEAIERWNQLESDIRANARTEDCEMTTDRERCELADLRVAYESLRDRARALAWAHIRVLQHGRMYPPSEIARHVRETEGLIVELRDADRGSRDDHPQREKGTDPVTDHGGSIPSPGDRGLGALRRAEPRGNVGS